jgi:hypothetical protein
MKPKWNTVIIIAVFSLANLSAAKLLAQKQNDEELLRARATVWRAWFAGDTRTLEKLVPPETIVMSGGEKEWKDQSDVVWSNYVLETEVDGKRSLGASRVTEIFVWQHGRWTNPGWHTDEEK